MNRERLLELAREFKRIYESNEPYIPGSSWTLTRHQQDHDRRVERAQRLLSLEHIPHLTEAELRELFSDTDALGFFRDQGKRDRELDNLLSGEGTERVRSVLLGLFQKTEAELTPDAFSEAQKPRGIGPLLISELLSHRFPSHYYPYSSNMTLPALKMLGEDVKAAQPHGKKGDHYLYFAIRPLMDEICNALREVGFTEVDYMLADMFVTWLHEVKPSDGPSPRYWKISPGKGGTYWNDFKDSSLIAIFWQVGDLRRFRSWEEIENLVRGRKETSESGWETVKVGYTCDQLWWFGHAMQVGDIVFAYSSKTILGVGRIVGEYEFEKDDDFDFHYRPVDWIELEGRSVSSLPRDLRQKLGQRMTIIDLSEHEGQQIMALYESGISPPPEPDRPQDGPNLSRYFAAHGLHFTSEQLATFYTALKTKGFVILTGISGTGKTKLAQYFAELLGSKDQFHFAAVRPDWKDSKSLLGYYNPLSEQFESTNFLLFILKAYHDLAVPYFVLLDEMNLAKIEYYFADLLSVLESGRQPDGFTKEAIRFQCPEGIDGLPRQLRLPPNLYFIGTVNVDETTYMFSPKVLDRAFTLELSEVDFAAYPSEQGDSFSQEELEALRAQLLPDFTNQGRFAIVDKGTVTDFVQQYPAYREHLTKLNVLLQPHDLHFGYRVFDEIMMFLANAEGSPVFDGFGPDELDAAFDAAVLMKVLPKFHGTRGKLRESLEKIIWWAREPGNPETGGLAVSEKLQNAEGIASLREGLSKRIGGESSDADAFTYPRTALKALRMLHDLYTTGFASFV
jgi:energy-coupling factor transporter ATP-binding protein EcfA2